MWDLLKNALQILFLGGIAFIVVKSIYDEIDRLKKKGRKKAVKSITGGVLSLVIGYIYFAALVGIPFLIIWFISWFFGLF